jgi:hypothetical protein
LSGRHWIGGGGEGGGNTERALKNGFGAFPYFLEITDVGEAYLLFEKINVLPKVYSTNRPHRLKTQKCFAKHYIYIFRRVKCFAKHFLSNTYVF